VFVLLPLLIFATAALRPERDRAVLQGFHDLAWMLLVGAATPFVLVSLATGIAVLRDHGEPPIFRAGTGT
jgi:hypothetical protein